MSQTGLIAAAVVIAVAVMVLILFATGNLGA